MDAGCTWKKAVPRYAYCVEVLHLSEDTTFGRIAATRAVRKYPIILDLLADGSVNLTTIKLLGPHLTPENHREVLEAATHLKREQVEELVARLRPQPAIPSSIRKLPVPAQTQTATEAPIATETPPAAEDLAPNSIDSDSFILSTPQRRPVIAPLAPERYKVEFTASAETRAKLLQAQELLRFQIPNGDVGEIIDRALTALLKNLTKQKFAAIDQPRENRKATPSVGAERSDHEPDESDGASVSHPRSRHIPAEVRRAVWERDGGQCAFISPDGRRCTARTFIEFHHVQPFAEGGEATIGNIELRCGAHNRYEFAKPTRSETSKDQTVTTPSLQANLWTESLRADSG